MSVENYIKHLLCDAIYSSSFDQAFGGKWLAADAMRQGIFAAFYEEPRKYGFRIDGRYDHIVDDLIEELNSASAMQYEGDQFTGEYATINVNRKDALIKKIRDGNEASIRINRLGGGAFSSALSRIAALEGWLPIDSNEPIVSDQSALESVESLIPASDRIVRLDDNSSDITAFVEKLNHLEDELRGENDPDGKLVDNRERLVHEIAAGRELLKGRSVRVRAVLAVLGSALAFFASEFAGGIIGQLATELLASLKPLLGI